MKHVTNRQKKIAMITLLIFFGVNFLLFQNFIKSPLIGQTLVCAAYVSDTISGDMNRMVNVENFTIPSADSLANYKSVCLSKFVKPPVDANTIPMPNDRVIYDVMDNCNPGQFIHILTLKESDFLSKQTLTSNDVIDLYSVDGEHNSFSRVVDLPCGNFRDDALSGTSPVYKAAETYQTLFTANKVTNEDLKKLVLDKNKFYTIMNTQGHIEEEDNESLVGIYSASCEGCYAVVSRTMVTLNGVTCQRSVVEERYAYEVNADAANGKVLHFDYVSPAFASAVSNEFTFKEKAESSYTGITDFSNHADLPPNANVLYVCM